MILQIIKYDELLISNESQFFTKIRMIKMMIEIFLFIYIYEENLLGEM